MPDAGRRVGKDLRVTDVMRVAQHDILHGQIESRLELRLEPLHVIAAAIRQEAARVAHDNTVRKRNAMFGAQFRDDVRTIFKK